MKSTIVAAALVLGITGSSRPVRAGGFVGLGVGTESHFDDGRGKFGPDGRSARFMVGYALGIPYGRLAIEGAYVGYGLTRANLSLDGHDLWVAGRYNYRLSHGFEVFGRLGIQRTSISNARESFDGKGPLISAGAEFHLKLGLDLAIWVDVTYDHLNLDDATSTGASDHFASLGVTVGF